MAELEPITSPTEIETASEGYLVAKMTNAFKDARRQSNMRYVFGNPAVVTWIDKGTFETLGGTKFRCHVPLHVELRISNAKGEEARRDAINPLVFAVIRTLARQKFGLAITGLIPKAFKDITTEDDYKNNLIVYDIEFATTFTVKLAEDEDADDFLTLALSYFLKPGDDEAAAADTVTLPQ